MNKQIVSATFEDNIGFKKYSVRFSDGTEKMYFESNVPDFVIQFMKNESVENKWTGKFRNDTWQFSVFIRKEGA